MYVFKSFFQTCITFLLTFYYMLLIGIPHVILAELANKTLRTAFSPFYLSSLESPLDQHSVPGIPYQLCNFARRLAMTATTTAITTVVKSQDADLSMLWACSA